MSRIFFILIFCSIASTAYSKELALTFDDAPRKATGYFDGQTRAKKIIQQLKKYKVEQVVFYAVTKDLDEEGISRLKKYSEAGHILANHTHSHPDFSQTSLNEFVEDFEKAHEKLAEFKNVYKFFRFPYLREGDTLQKRDGMRNKLKELGYRNAYITLNNYDWYIEELFQNAIADGKEVDLKKLSALYVDVIIQGIEYYDEMAIKHLDRSPKHVLLLHEMDVTALFIGDLVDELRSKGWEIISSEDAYTDPIANYQIKRPLRFNPGRIGEIAIDNGQRKDLWHKTLDEKYLEQRFNQEVLVLD